MTFLERHYCIGKLHMEYINEGCEEKGEICWVGPRFSRVPAPYQDPENPGHYMNVFEIPTTINDGQQRPVDDFALTANLKQLFKDGAILSGDSEKMKEAASRYFVEEKHVLGYIRHLEELQVVSAIREEDQKKNRAADNNKAYKDYDWENIITSKKLATLKVKELEKYLKEHNLSFMGKKEDKVK
jgi:hypothetical protein